jgi:hypothetical protein
MTKVAEVDELLGSGAGGTKCGLARAERSLILALAEPSERAAGAEDDTTAHAPKLEQWKEGTVGHNVLDLQSPASIGGCRQHR